MHEAPEATVPMTGTRGRWSALPDGLVDAIALFLTLRVALSLVAAYAWWKGGLPGPCHFEVARDGWLTIPRLADGPTEFPLVGVWQRWDACWYGKIASFGYEPAEMSVNFWPMFPILTGLTGRLVDGSVALGGLIVSSIAYIAAMVGLVRLVGRDFDGVIGRRTILLLSIFPSAFFLFAPFTEATFLALAVWSIAMARERRWLLAFVFGFLAGLTRIQGVFLLLPIGWEALAAAGLTAWRPWRSGACRPSRPERSSVAGWRPVARSSRSSGSSRSPRRLPARRPSTRRTRGAARSSSRRGRWRRPRGAGPWSATTRSSS